MADDFLVGDLSKKDLMSLLYNATTTAVSLGPSEDGQWTNPVTEESDNPTAYRRISFVIAWLTLALCIFGLIGNTFSIIIYAHPSMRSPINLLLMGTSYIDFMLSLLAVPTFVIPGIYAYYNTPTLGALSAYCTAYVYPLCITMQSASVWAFVVITIERYNAVCTPFQAKWSSIQRSRLALIVVCALAVAYNAVRFFEFRLNYGDPTSNNETNDTSFRFVDVEPVLRNSKSYMNIYYIGMFLVTHFVVPFTILVILNALIIRTIWQSRQRRRALNRKERSEHRTAIMMVIVVSTFIGCYTLLFILNILDAANPDLFYDSRYMALLFALNDISNVLVVANAASSIIVYYFFSQKYRQLLVALLTRFCPGCVQYMEVSTCDLKHNGSEKEGASRMDVARENTVISPLLTNTSPPSGNHLRPNGVYKAAGSAASSASSSLLTPPHLVNDVKMNLIVTSYSPSSATAENDDGITSEPEET